MTIRHTHYSADHTFVLTLSADGTDVLDVDFVDMSPLPDDLIAEWEDTHGTPFALSA